jgi:ATP-dependent Clp protease adaptor protein ClpS
MSETNQTIEQPQKPSPEAKTAPKRRVDSLPPYHVVLLDDDDHTYEYVIDMLQSLFSHAEEQAFLLARQVDKTGRAVVCTTHKERAELKRDQILGHGCDFRIPKSKQSMKAVIQPAET